MKTIDHFVTEAEHLLQEVKEFTEKPNHDYESCKDFTEGVWRSYQQFQRIVDTERRIIHLEEGRDIDKEISDRKLKLKFPNL